MKKPAPKAGAKKNAASSSSRPAGPGAIAAGGGLGDANSAAIAEPSSSSAPSGTAIPEEIESFAATGLDNALDLLEIVTAKTDKASVGQQAAGMERHPEVSITSSELSVAAEVLIFINLIASVQGFPRCIRRA